MEKTKLIFEDTPRFKCGEKLIVTDENGREIACLIAGCDGKITVDGICTGCYYVENIESE